MPLSSITINFATVPSADTVINITESYSGINLNQIFKSNRLNYAETDLPTFKAAHLSFPDRWDSFICDNYKDALELDYNGSGLFSIVSTRGAEYSGIGSVTITALYPSASFGVTSNTSGASVTSDVVTPETTPSIPTISLPDLAVLSRSPFFISHNPSVYFDEIRAELFIYRGDKLIDKPATANYSLSKKIVLALQPKISFDIHKLVNDYVKNNYVNVLGIGANTTSVLDSVWCHVVAGIYENGTFKYGINQQLLIVDGFGYTTELSNPVITKKVLSSINAHVIYTGANYPLYFITKDLTSITVSGVNVPFTFNQAYNNQVVGYVNISNYIGSSNSFNAVFVYSDETVIHSFSIKEECKYPVINCIFKNKFGFWQTIPFNKLSKKSIDFENSNYTGLVAAYGDYDLSQHENKTFLLNGKEKVTVNTDFISENYNALFTELMLSEFIYLEENGEVLPVNLLKKSFEKKTKLINKLIQYSMDFEYSFKLMNTIL